MYDETGAKAYESLRNNTVAMLKSPDVIDFAIMSMLLNITDAYKVNCINTGVEYGKCELIVNDDGTIECKKTDSDTESE